MPDQTNRNDDLRRIPSVERLLSHPPMAGVIERRGRELTRRAITRHLDEIRSGAQKGLTLDEVTAAVEEQLSRSAASSLMEVVNGTGVLIHTNMGRSPISREIWESSRDLVSHYSNLELDVESGARGHRDVHLQAVARELFGCEDAVLTNNNAAATLLLVAATAAGREVVVSRGELVEIGGSFRVPEVIEQSGARLREVGTTNRTRTADYVTATGADTAAWLRVHRSNFAITGFTEEPEIADLAKSAGASGMLFLYDEGSGRVVDLARYGFGAAPTIRELIATGIDAVTFSTDKLVGATQGGLIAGSRAVIERCRRHPLMRALRAGKESYAVVVATLRVFLEERHELLIPLYSMMSAGIETLHERATRIAAASGAVVVAMNSAAGGGTTPGETIPSWGVAAQGQAEEMAAYCRSIQPPVIGVIQDGQFRIDLRTVFPSQDAYVEATLGRRL